MSRDPFAGVTRTPLSLNRYSYVLNNPVNGGDPSGLAGGSICACDQIGTVRGGGSRVKEDGSSYSLMCDAPTGDPQQLMLINAACSSPLALAEVPVVVQTPQGSMLSVASLVLVH